MKKWMTSVIGSVVLVILVVGAAGCGGQKASKIDVDEETVKQPSGHEQMLKQINKKPGAN